MISKTKLDESFRNAQFKLNGYEVRARRDKHKHGSGLELNLLDKALSAKNLKNVKLLVVSFICSEFIKMVKLTAFICLMATSK